jgi:hypothetical protein
MIPGTNTEIIQIGIPVISQHPHRPPFINPFLHSTHDILDFDDRGLEKQDTKPNSQRIRLPPNQAPKAEDQSPHNHWEILKTAEICLWRAPVSSKRIGRDHSPKLVPHNRRKRPVIGRNRDIRSCEREFATEICINILSCPESMSGSRRARSGISGV